MFEGIGALANPNQENHHAVHNPTDGLRETAADVVEGKINPLESPDNPSDKFGPEGETSLPDVGRRESDEGRIIEVLG